MKKNLVITEEEKEKAKKEAKKGTEGKEPRQKA